MTTARYAFIGGASFIGSYIAEALLDRGEVGLPYFNVFATLPGRPEHHQFCTRMKTCSARVNSILKNMARNSVFHNSDKGNYLNEE